MSDTAVLILGFVVPVLVTGLVAIALNYLVEPDQVEDYTVHTMSWQLACGESESRAGSRPRARPGSSLP
jgi:hypothetical protein